MDVGRLNLEWAAELIGTFARSGITAWVISPGSRSTPLALACRRRTDLTAVVLPDERCAAFFALGMARAMDAAVGVIATSGTAPANWYPAIIEAAQDHVPLVLVSADRPVELQRCGANQTVDQQRMFPAHIRGFVQLSHPDPQAAMFRRLRFDTARAADLCRWPLPGPVHVNVPLREPLVPGPAEFADVARCGTGTGPQIAASPRLVPDPAAIRAIGKLLDGGRGLIVCGRGRFPDRFAGDVFALADSMRCPVLADPLSGLRFGAGRGERLVVHYDTFLGRDAFSAEHRPRWVLRFGAAPVSRALENFLQGAGEMVQVLVSPFGEWQDPTLGVTHVMHGDVAEVCSALRGSAGGPAPAEWERPFLEAERRERRRLETDHDLPLEAMVVRTVVTQAAEGASVFCGNSMVIRDVDSFSGQGPAALELLGNRGASGIDGNVSTICGIAAGTGARVIGLLGDLALYHDMNGLLAMRDRNVTLIVFNNGGGAIFSYLPQSDLPEFESLWLTPTGLDPAGIASLYGIGHYRVGDADGFAEAFRRANATDGPAMIEVVVDREESVRRHRAFRAPQAR